MNPEQFILTRSYFFIHNARASIGFNLEALFAGKIPKRMPTKAEKIMLPIATFKEIIGGPSREAAARVVIKLFTP